MNKAKAMLIFPDKSVMNMPIDSVTNLPILYSFESTEKAAEKLEQSLYSCVSAKDNQNLSKPAKDVLKWHWRLGHPGMGFVRWLAKQGLLDKSSKAIGELEDNDLFFIFIISPQ